MPKKPSGDRSTSVPSDSTTEIDDEILGSIAALSGENDDDGDVGPTPPPAIPVSQARRVGAINAEAVQSNRRRKAVLDKKRDGEKNIPWGEQDACLLYDDIIDVWPPATVLTHVTRISGSRTSWYLRAQPRNGMDLHEAIRSQIHGRSPECEYQIVFRDAQTRVERGRANLILPNGDVDSGPTFTPPTPQAPPQASAPPAPQAPYPPQQPLGYPPHGYPPQGYPPNDPPPGRWGAQERPAPPPPPPVVQSADPVVVMQLQRQLSEISAQLQGLGKAQSNPVAQQLADIQSQLDRMVHQQQRPNAPAPVQVVHAPAPPPPMYAPPPPAPPPPPPPPPPKMPEVPPGYALTMISGMPCFVPLTNMPGLGAPPAAAPVAAAPPPPPPPQIAPQLSPTEQFAQTIGVVKGAVDAVRSLQAILPTAAPAAAVAEAPEAPEPDDAPTKNVKIGDVNTVQNTADGSIRPVDTFIANLPQIMSWAERQRNDIIANQEKARAAAATSAGQPLPQQPSTQQIGVPVIPGR